MNREQELEIIDRCLGLHAAGSTTLSDAVTLSPVSRYTCRERYEKEQLALHKSLPTPYLHVTELPASNSFKRVDTSIGDILFTRAGDGIIRAFHNVCRHRGAMLVQAESGCSARLTCPYHAWSYQTDGSLASVPDQENCFPGLDINRLGLSEITCVERYGMVWLCPAEPRADTAVASLDQFLGPVAADIAWLEMDGLELFARSSRRWKANWKLLSEGGLETYHFRTAHRKTIGPYFLNNLSDQSHLQGHARVVMPSKKIQNVAGQAREDRRLRDFTHTVYGIAPATTFLSQENHIDWVRMTPTAVDETEIVITTLVPAGIASKSEERLDHWQANHEITLTTLDEDFEIGEGIQRGLASGANSELTFGRNEGMLAALNDWVDAQLS